LTIITTKVKSRLFDTSKRE